MPRLLSKLFASGIPINLTRWVQLNLVCSSALGACMRISTEQAPNPFLDLHDVKQALGNMISTHSTINPIALMKFMDSSLSLYDNRHFCSILFSQLQGLLTTELCNFITRTYTNSGRHLRSILVYTYMYNVGIVPDCATMPSVIKSVAQLSCGRLGKSIHAQTVRMGFSVDLFVNSALVSMYSTCRNVEDARRLFDEMTDRNSVSWNAIITGYTHNRRFREALEMFREMQILGIEPTEVTVVSVLSACAHLGALSQGKWIHNYINNSNIMLNVYVGTALVDMYAKCGCIDESEKVFWSMGMRNIYTWNALIWGFAMNGKGELALDIFTGLCEESLNPDGVTYLAVLSACCHQGLVNEGRKLFTDMKSCGLNPKVEHYGCMVDLLGRAGLLDEAVRLIRDMPMKADAVIWRALLGACRIHGNTHLTEVAIKNLRELEPYNGENYVLLSNLYARDRRWNDLGKVRAMMSGKGIQKVPGCSSIEIDLMVYEFVVSSQSEGDGMTDIWKMLHNMDKALKVAGYVIDTGMVSYDVEEEEKESSLMHHSEKLALAFGLLRTSPGSDIRIVKNLRVCRDCHCYFKLVSKVYERTIIVRDRNRFHHFGEGFCSCRDYW